MNEDIVLEVQDVVLDSKNSLNDLIAKLLEVLNGKDNE